MTTSFADRLNELHQAIDALETRASAILQKPDVDAVLLKKTQKMLRDAGPGQRSLVKKSRLAETQDEADLEQVRSLVDMFGMSVDLIDQEYDNYKARGKKF